MDSCTDYDWALFFRVAHQIIPEVLRRATDAGVSYRVKGGRAADAYFDNPYKTYSPDFDVLVQSEDYDQLVSILEDGLREYSIPYKQERQLFQVEGQPDEYVNAFGLETCDANFIDIISRQALPPGMEIDGIWYADARSIYSDLERTLKDREAAAQMGGVDDDALQNIAKRNYNTYREDVKELLGMIREDEDKADIIEFIKQMARDTEDLLKQTVDATKAFLEYKPQARHQQIKLDKTRRRYTQMGDFMQGKPEVADRRLISQFCSSCRTGKQDTVELFGVPCDEFQAKYCSRLR